MIVIVFRSLLCYGNMNDVYDLTGVNYQYNNYEYSFRITQDGG